MGMGIPTYRPPAGSVIMFGASTVPSGWLECDGSAVSRSTYAGLFAVISTTYGTGDGSTTFNLPNFKGRSPVGVGQGNTAEGGGAGTSRTLAATGGAETHTLTVAELAAHDHSTLGVSAVTTGGGAVNRLNVNAATTGSTGGDDPHNNMHPFLVVKFIIKT